MAQPDRTLTPLLYTIAPIVATLAGGVIAAYAPPSDKVRSILQHVAAGVVFAAAAVEILPDVIHADAPLVALIGAGLGVAAMLALEASESRFEGPVGLAVITAFDVFVDGFVLGLSFLVGVKQGILLTIALTLELLFLGLAVAASLTGRSKATIIGVSAGLAVFLPIGAVVGLMLAGLSPVTLSGFYAFALIALLYLVTEELLTEAHKTKDTALMPAAFFAGFIALMILSELM